VGYALDDNNKALIDDATKAKVDELSAQIQSGAITVHDYTTDNTCPGV
jgi:basic membrane protein A